jgi:hypothetical protein
LLIWAVGITRDDLREACDACTDSLHDVPEFAPVLVTDLADFAYFSRLGWLVEYLPRISGSGEAFESRKSKYLARLYSKAPALPASAFLATNGSAIDIRRWITTASTSATAA